eukprot:NODE_3985_length_861_cov_79.245232_g3830_i0.p1 GENE.NODE_3985_length_861_cov_79.245232_g3830_i0~~NODE_3985_length_861_cov_79.245232_g3830_i0.p1  ORF type:complete len:268 (+),score=49.04 NODE_3985_length_861_cov_79.245232_g3830_i0:3-806(+)
MEMAEAPEEVQSPTWFETSTASYQPAQPLPPTYTPPEFTSVDLPTDPHNSFLDGLRSQVTEHAVQFVAHEAKAKASGFGRYLSLDWLIDLVAPYFDIDGFTVLQRIKVSLLPRAQPFSQHHPDLYGPLMINFTLALLLMLNIKAHQKREGTAIGTALALCFGYWVGGSAILLVLTYVTNTHLNFTNILCALGYAMSSILLLTPASYVLGGLKGITLLYIVVAACSCCSLGLTFKSATSSPERAVSTAVATGAFHLLFLIYVRYAYLA